MTEIAEELETSRGMICHRGRVSGISFKGTYVAPGQTRVFRGVAGIRRAGALHDAAPSPDGPVN